MQTQTADTFPSVTIYTDGACSGNPGPGGWAALLICNNQEKMISGYDDQTTNNRMELKAAIEGLSALTTPCCVDLFTDSQYVKGGIQTWIHAWKANNWKKADRQDVKNIDLWQQLDALNTTHKVQWHWVKGHSGDPRNTRVDIAARQEIALNSVLKVITSNES
ncbi:MAG: ribonuclease HI [Alphaproteobacteria bacterium]|nr:ribonuclease HI [Alphaproteobacteria bacterium]OJV45811.1 MAG: ribonuclease HI [Alphaproteobacteria bacterium 43-37]